MLVNEGAGGAGGGSGDAWEIEGLLHHLALDVYIRPLFFPKIHRRERLLCLASASPQANHS